MTELEAVRLVQTDTAEQTDFDSPHWAGVDPIVLQSCFDKGVIRWQNNKLAITPLGRRSCGGARFERHN